MVNGYAVVASFLSVDKTWASGPLELLAHAKSHFDFASPFDRRIAYISLDNAVEQTLRTYLELPARFFRPAAPPSPLGEEADFKELLQAVFAHAKDKLSGISRSELLKFHELRNVIYHRSVGSDVDSRFLDSYLATAEKLLLNLFGVALREDSPILSAFRSDLYESLEEEVRASTRLKHSKRVSKALDALKEQGRTMGRSKKSLSAKEFELARRLNNELGWGGPSIAVEINTRRGAHLLTDRKARVDASVSKALIVRRLTEAGCFTPGGTRKKPQDLIPEGFE